MEWKDLVDGRYPVGSVVLVNENPSDSIYTVTIGEDGWVGVDNIDMEAILVSARVSARVLEQGMGFIGKQIEVLDWLKPNMTTTGSTPNECHCSFIGFGHDRGCAYMEARKETKSKSEMKRQAALNVGVTIGQFKFWLNREAKLWIYRDSGEAMECSNETQAALESILEQFWEANF